jgi:DNA-binding LacI/PurR family transcriptional regulator
VRAGAVRSGHRPTINDVAAAAGVSRGTVSRVLNGGHFVSSGALAAVESAIRTTGYQANNHARSLVTGRANSVAFVLAEPPSRLLDDPTYGVVMSAAAEELARRKIPLLLMVAGTPEEQRWFTDYIAGGHVDGALVVNPHTGSPVIPSLLAHGVPTVGCGAPIGLEDRVGFVEADEIGGARRMVRFLTERGRQTIGTITGPLDTPGGLKRLEGYRRELADHYDPSLVACGGYTRAGGRRAMSQLLERKPDLDAVFVASDLMAAGAYRALEEAGRRVPDDVAVGGFDDSGIAATLSPGLTTMRQPFERIAQEMVRLLLDVVAGNEAASVTLPTTLVERQSA